jgi:hypothetical protein
VSLVSRPRRPALAAHLALLGVITGVLAGCGPVEESAGNRAAVTASGRSSTTAPTSTGGSTGSRTGTAPSGTVSPSAPPPAGEKAGEPGSALALLQTLPVKGRAPKTGYDRAAKYGPAWADIDHNGCDTRNDLLHRDLRAVQVKAGTHGCVVVSGRLADPYTASTIEFAKARASEVQIDHVVALSDSWQKGAQSWPYRKRLAMANDPLNLLAVEGGQNMSKGDSDAASWLPRSKGYRCEYVARQVAVKAKYGLWVTTAERDAIRRVLDTCPDSRAPQSTTPTLAPSGFQEPSAVTTKPEPTKDDAPVGGTDPQFGSCREAIEAGFGPYRRGADAEYDWYRDGDGDGIVCER